MRLGLIALHKIVALHVLVPFGSSELPKLHKSIKSNIDSVPNQAQF